MAQVKSVPVLRSVAYLLNDVWALVARFFNNMIPALEMLILGQTEYKFCPHLCANSVAETANEQIIYSKDVYFQSSMETIKHWIWAN